MSKPFISSMRRRSFSSSGARRRRMPTFSRIERSRAYSSIHVVALKIGDHFECELVVIAQKKTPLTSVGNRRCLLQNFRDGFSVFEPLHP